MDFGALPAHRPFDSRLAPLFPAGVHRLGGKPREDFRLDLGGPQWNVPEWVGKVYPRGTKSAQFLEAYSAQWGSIELNTSFYRVPTLDQVKSWADRTPGDFRFSVKVHRDLSHDPAVWADGALRRARIEGFVKAWTELGEKWRESFLQLPPDFPLGEFARLRAWIGEWPERFPLHVEFRHPSWFADRQLRAEVREFLEARNVGAVITDTPGRRDASHGTLTSDRLLVRFLGQSIPDRGEVLAVDRERIEAWAKRVAGLASRGLRHCSFFFHTPDLFYVPEHCAEFVEIIHGQFNSLGIAPSLSRVPRALPRGVVSPDSQASLFD